MFKQSKLVSRSPRQGSMSFHSLALVAAAAGSLAVAVGGCGIAIQRDLSSVKVNEVAYDDLCHLQDYFDSLKDTSMAPPQELFNQALTSDTGEEGGKSRYRFNSEFQLKTVRRVLTENWKRLPEKVASADPIELEVRWSQKAGLRRVVTTEEAVLQVGDRSYYLPYHVCLSELLFGEPLYETRRTFLALPSSQSSRQRPVATPGIEEPAPAPQGDVPVTPVAPTPAPTPTPQR